VALFSPDSLPLAPLPMLLSVTGDGLLHKQFKDLSSGQTIYFFESRATYVRETGPVNQRTRVIDAKTSEVLACIDWVGMEPVSVIIGGKTKASLWDVVGRGTNSRDRMCFTTPHKMDWILEESLLTLQGKGQSHPVAQYYPQMALATSIPPRDLLQIADDLHGIDIGELLVGWILMERIRMLRWTLHRYKWRTPHDSVELAVYRIQSATRKLGFGKWSRGIQRRGSV